MNFIDWLQQECLCGDNLSSLFDSYQCITERSVAQFGIKGERMEEIGEIGEEGKGGDQHSEPEKDCKSVKSIEDAYA